jgi:hypothetical protein
MVDWMHSEIDRWLSDNNKNVDGAKFLAWLKARGPDSSAIEAAQSGNIEPLRKLYPHLAPFLTLPTLPHGQKWKDRRLAAYDAATAAAMLVPIIREIWKQHYHKKNRRPEDGYSAVEIAASYLEVKPSAVERKRKNLTRKRAFPLTR